ncbi:hypothetical protein [Arthrobacter sp. TMN-50]
MDKLLASLAAAGLVLLGGAPSAIASPPPDHKVTYCHATGSETNPFVVITTDEIAVVRGHQNHQDLEDVIPPFDWALPNASGSFPGLNWGPGAEEFIANGCVAAPPTS